MIFVRGRGSKVAKCGDFIFNRSWNPGCLQGIICPLIHIFTNQVWAKENMFVGRIRATDCKFETFAWGEAGVLQALESEGSGSNFSFLF